MKRHLTTINVLTFSLALSSSLFAQDSSSGTAAADTATSAGKTDNEVTGIVAVTQQFSNLPKEARQEYANKLIKVQNMFNQKRIFDALEKLDELDKIFPNHPAAMNIRGACYVEMRAFDKANAIFQEVLKISPESSNVLFNLAEVDFVTKNWVSAEKRFNQLIPMLPEANKKMIRLCEFKLLLCQLKLNKKNEAVAMVGKYDAWDDSPFFYFSRAAIAYNENKELEAETFLSNARYVWRDNAALAPWQDTMIEFGYIRSFYGGEDEAKK